MKKFLAMTMLSLLLLNSAYGQRINFPVGLSAYDSIPKVELAGAVRTVLTMEHRSDRVFSTYVETYDQQKRMTEFLSHSGGRERHSGEMTRNDDKDIYIYNAAGKAFKVISFNLEGLVNGYEMFAHDSKGRLSELVYYWDKGEKQSKDVYTYRPEKREVEIKSEGSSVLIASKVVLTYNEKNQWIKRTNFDESGSIKSVETFDYDKKGNVIKITHYDEKGDYSYAHIYTYKSDKLGNWVEQNKTYTQLDESGQPTTEYDMTIYRVITYYTDNQTSNMASTALSDKSFEPTPR